MMKYKTNRRISTPPPLLLPNMLRGTAFAVATVVCLFARETACFSSISISQRALSLRRSSPSSSSSLPISTTVLSATKTTPTPTVVKGPRRVAVAGATGRVGRLVVNELLTSYTADGGDGIGATSGTTVIALVRSKTKAEDVFPAALRPANLAVVVCDLSNEQQVTKALQGCQAVVWCASGTTSSSVASAADQSILGKLKSALGIAGAAMKPSNIDTTAFPLLTKALPKPHVVATNVNGSDGKEPVLLPQVVMCSACAGRLMLLVVLFFLCVFLLSFASRALFWLLSSLNLLFSF
jgi:NAD(P)H-binding